jgi:hypothetical protein
MSSTSCCDDLRVTIDELLQRIVMPRPNGSAELERVGAFLSAALQGQGAQVTREPFVATPHGFELAFAAALALATGYALAIAVGRYRLALGLLFAAAALLLAEFELLWSPVSGLLPATLYNVVGTFPGVAGGPRLVFVAHYDTTTHFGNHATWGPTGLLLGPAVALGAALAITGWLRARRGRALEPGLRALALLTVAPFAAMAWFHTAGPSLRTPSPGAIDNGGSVVALLRLADRLGSRPDDAATTVELVFTAAEEERALGSWAHAATLPRDGPLGVVNLESIGAGGPLGYASGDGFMLRRYETPLAFVHWLGAAAQAAGVSLVPMPLPVGTLTDARSYLAQHIAAVTLRPSFGGAFPTDLHSEHDAIERLSNPAIEDAALLLDTLVRRADADPSAFAAAARP